MANSDLAVEALFRKAGIVRCYGREELTTVMAFSTVNHAKGKRLAVFTHAGGPTVMLTDSLENGGLKIPAHCRFGSKNTTEKQTILRIISGKSD